MMKSKGMKLAAICLTGAIVAGSVYSPVSAAKKVTIKGKKKVSMKVGEKKQFKANQKVKWTVKGKSIAIVKGKNAKAVTVQAKKKGSSTLTAKKGKKKAAVRIQVTNKGVDQNNTNTNSNTNNNTNTNTNTNNTANITDMTLLTDITFYKVTNVNGNNITMLSADNKEYTTTVKADIPIMKDSAVITADSIKAGEYFRCSSYTYSNGKENITAYAAIVISESVYQMIMEYRNKGNAQYTKNVATFYIIGKNDSVVDLACYQGGPKYTEVIIDEDMITTVNGVKDKDAGDRLQIGQRVLFEYGWEDPKGHFVNPNSLVVY